MSSFPGTAAYLGLDAFAVGRYRALSARSPRDRELDRSTLRAFDQVVADAVHHGRRNRALDRTVAHAFRALADADLAGDRPSRPIRRALVAQFHRLYYHSRARTWALFRRSAWRKDWPPSTRGWLKYCDNRPSDCLSRTPSRRGVRARRRVGMWVGRQGDP